MRKLFLLGTMLGVASAALAFGGMFNHGSKSTTYKGGVDAIGVHFGGEKSTDSPVLEPCPEGLEHNSDGSCTVCANGNVYLSYNDDPCGTETPMNQTPCESDDDCFQLDADFPIVNCCDITNHTCKAARVIWGDDGELVCPIENKPCKSNKDCTRNEYCSVSYNYDYQYPSLGSCEPLEAGLERTFNDEIYLVYDSPLDFWSAENWCRAHGRHMVGLSDLGVTQTCEDVFDGDCWSADWDQISTLFTWAADCIITVDHPYVVWDGWVESESGFHSCDGWMNLTVCR